MLVQQQQQQQKRITLSQEHKTGSKDSSWI